MLRSLLITFFLIPALGFAQELPTQFTGQNAIHSNPARIGMHSNFRVSSSVQNPNNALGTGLEYFYEKWQLGIGAGIYRQTTSWAHINKLSLALNKKWGSDQKFVSAALLLNSFSREFLPPYEEYNYGVQYPLGYATTTFGLNSVVNRWNFDAMAELNIGSEGGRDTRIYTQVARQFYLGEWYIEPSIRNYADYRLIGHDLNVMARYKHLIAGAGVTVSAAGTYLRPMAGFQRDKWSLFYGLKRYQGGSWSILIDPIPVNHELSLQINPFGMKTRESSWIM